MSETVERVAGVIAHAGAAADNFEAVSRAAIESLRTPDPHVIARAADRLGIPPTEAAKLAGMWIVVVEEMLK